MSFNSGMKGADVVSLLKNGLPIVDSVDKLDANATFGSIACVAKQGSVSEMSFKDLYQPDVSIFDFDTGDVDVSGCDQVESIKIIPPVAPIPIAPDMSEDPDLTAWFISEDFDWMGGGSTAVINPIIEDVDGIGTAIVGCIAMTMSFAENVPVEYLLFYVDDYSGEVVVNQEEINAFNNFMSGFYYVGPLDTVVDDIPIPETYVNMWDSLVKVVAGQLSRAHIYLKKDGWEKLYQTDFDKLTKDLTNTALNLNSIREDVESRAYKIPVSTNNGHGIAPNVYNTIVISTTSTKFIRLAAIQDPSVYNEYILELKCTQTPSNVVFEDEDLEQLNIKWSNGIAPVFEQGFTYLISIVNGFGVYSSFVNE